MEENYLDVKVVRNVRNKCETIIREEGMKVAGLDGSAA